MKILFCSVIFSALFFNSCSYAPGSYPYAEVYELEMTEEELIRATIEFKLENPEFSVPIDIGLVDGRSDSITDHWYHVWFYYRAENKIIYTWVRENKMAFVSVNEGLEIGSWKLINKDMSRAQSKKEMRIFEDRILNKVKETF
jgi:hypothetical protein